MNHLSYHLLLDMGNNVNGKYYLNDSWPFMSLDQFSVNPLSRQSNLASKPSIGPEIVKVCDLALRSQIIDCFKLSKIS